MRLSHTCARNRKKKRVEKGEQRSERGKKEGYSEDNSEIK